MRKTTSTNAINEEAMLERCGMSYTLNVIGGRWKPAILFCLMNGTMRYNELRKNIEGVSERMLVAQLRELEDHGLVKRTIYPEVPPKVEYELTAVGRDTAPMLKHMSEWGNRHRLNKNTGSKKEAEKNPVATNKETDTKKQVAIAGKTKQSGTAKQVASKKKTASKKEAAVV